MKEVKKMMIRKYRIKQLGFDFMGYSLSKHENYTFHHLILPKRYGGKESVENGAILCSKCSHPYLHLIEQKDYEIFLGITSEMIDQNIKGQLDIENLKRIHNLLCYFEREYRWEKSNRGELIIKEEYIRRRSNIF